MKRLCFFLALTLTLCLLSCREDDNGLETRITSNGQRIQVAKHSTLLLNPTALKVSNRKPYSEKAVLDTLYGALMTWETDFWLKIVFTEPTASLQANKVYYARPALCTQELEAVGYNEFRPYYKDANHMGLFLPVGMGEIGCTVSLIDKEKAKCETHLLYVGYDEKLQEVGAYYPVHPNKLVWYVYKSYFDWGIEY